MSHIHEKKVSLIRTPWFQSIIALIVIFGSLAGYIYWQSVAGVVSVEKSYLEAPIVHITPSAPGILNTIYVQDGERVQKSTPVALVGSETLYAKEDGIVDGVPKVIGSYYTPGQTLLSVIVNTKMRVVAQVEETGGLNKVAVGQRVKFTVDAFPQNEYVGMVDDISSASSETGIAFSISDKRPIKKFNIYVSFDVSKYPELKTGMSARTWIYTK